MKRIVAVLLALCLAFHGEAQTWDEWFRQQETQVKYLVEQITALKMYGSSVQQGYDLVNEGLSSIGHLKNEDLRLHQEHFASLLTVKAVIKDNKIVRHLVSLQASILDLYQECRQKLSGEDEFSSSEKDYFENVFDTMLRECKAIAEEVVSLTTDGHYQMSDAERLKRLQALDGIMEEMYVFTGQFRNEIATTAFNRVKEKRGVAKLKSFY